MNIGVGSQNKTKVEAVREVLREYARFANSEVIGIDPMVEQYGHPKDLSVVISGARERAVRAYEGRDYGFGIESGLMAVPEVKSGYVEIAACAIYDGSDTHLGFSQAYEWPRKVIDGILKKGMDGSQALKAAGFTEKQKVGEHEGFVGIFTGGRLNRTEYNKSAVMMALMRLENIEHY
jgi:inosine/xanthosine triphosphatase